MAKEVFTDQMGRKVEINFPPQRIVSLVPSQTELLYDLGLTDEVVGQTLFCIHPEGYHQTKPRVGGTKNFKPAKIAALRPDLIIGNKEENDQKGIEELAQHYPVWMSDIKTLDDALAMIARVGALVNRRQQAHNIVSSITQSFEQLRGVQTSVTKLQAAYFIWRKPWMAAGHDTFITDMLKRLGLENVFAAETSRYPEVTEEMIRNADLDLVLLSSEPYPFKQGHINELQDLCPDTKILLVDGELFSWYGSRLLHSVTYFQQLIKQINGSYPLK